MRIGLLSSTLTTIIQHREYVTVQYLHLCTKLDIVSQKFFILPKGCLSHSHSCSYILITSCILCYPATQIFKSSHLLQRHVVQYYTPLHSLRFCRSIHNHHFCLFYIDLHSIGYALHVLFSLSTIFCIFFLLSATNTASSAYLRSVILTPPNLIPSTFFMAFFIINSL